MLLDDDSDRAEWHRFGIADSRGAFWAARNVRAFLPGRSWWEERGVWLIGIEDPTSRGHHVTKSLGMIAGALATRLPQDVTVIQTRPGEWKRLTVGRAHASKVDVATWVVGGKPVYDHRSDWTQDACDAYCIAYAVRKLNNDAIARTA